MEGLTKERKGEGRKKERKEEGKGKRKEILCHGQSHISWNKVPFKKFKIWDSETLSSKVWMCKNKMPSGYLGSKSQDNLKAIQSIQCVKCPTGLRKCPPTPSRGSKPSEENTLTQPLRTHSSECSEHQNHIALFSLFRLLFRFLIFSQVRMAVSRGLVTFQVPNRDDGEPGGRYNMTLDTGNLKSQDCEFGQVNLSSLCLSFPIYRNNNEDNNTSQKYRS